MRSSTYTGIAVLLGLAAWTTTRPTVVDDAALRLRANEGRVYLGEDPFSGVAESSEGGFVSARTSYTNGKKQGVSERWFPNRTLGFKATYHQNRRHGVARTWWEDGTLRSENHYENGVPDGVQREWYRDGAAFKELNLVDGREEGAQRAWRENGKLYSNYEARDGRIFGLKRSTLCYELDDEQVVINS